MKDYKFIFILMASVVFNFLHTGSYLAFADVPDGHIEVVGPVETNHTGKAKNLYQNIMLSESDMQIALGKRDFYIQERGNVRNDILKTTEELEILPDSLQKQYSMFKEAGNGGKVKISYSELLESYEEKERSLNENLDDLKQYAIEIDMNVEDLDGKISVIKASQEFKNISVSLAKADTQSISDSKAQKMLEQKILKKKREESRNLLKDYNIRTISLCNFSCGECYTCKLLYPKDQDVSFGPESSKVLVAGVGPE